MKIAIWHNLPSGGGKRALYEQVQSLVGSGHQVEAWCPPTVDQFFLPLNQLIRENIIPLVAHPRPTKARAHWRNRLSRWVGTRMRNMEEHCRLCADEISKGDFDVLLAHPCRFFRASPIAQFTKLPNVLYLQEPFRELYEAWPRLPWAAFSRPSRAFSPGYWQDFFKDLIVVQGHRIQVREELKWVKSFDQILVNSLFSRESVVRTYNLDARVCYLGVDTSHFKPTGSPKERFVIGLGNIFFNKRPLFALQCIAAIPAEKRPKLVWVGNFGHVDEVKSEAAKLGVDFEFRILIPDDELKDLLSRAAVMIYTSHLEPFGYAPVEANACGTAVVGIGEGGVRESVGHPDSGMIILNLDPQLFADALLKFCDDLPFATEFGKRSRAYVERCWSKEIAAKSLQRELEKVVSTRARGR